MLYSANEPAEEMLGATQSYGVGETLVKEGAHVHVIVCRYSQDCVLWRIVLTYGTRFSPTTITMLVLVV
jgi:hypothetical protein